MSEYAAYFSYTIIPNFPLLKYASNVPCFKQVCAALKNDFAFFEREFLWLQKPVYDVYSLYRSQHCLHMGEQLVKEWPKSLPLGEDPM